jgi:hypothetical protein
MAMGGAGNGYLDPQEPDDATGGGMTDDPPRRPDEAQDETTPPDAEPPPDPDAPTDDIWEGNTLKEAAPGD